MIHGCWVKRYEHGLRIQKLFYECNIIDTFIFNYYAKQAPIYFT